MSKHSTLGYFKSKFLFHILSAVAIAFFHHPLAQAYQFISDPSLIDQALSETYGGNIEPMDLLTDDYEVVWDDKPPFEVKAEFLSSKADWARVAELIMIPRAVLTVKIDIPKQNQTNASEGTNDLRSVRQIESVAVDFRSYHHVFSKSDKGFKADFPVPLIGGQKNGYKLITVESPNAPPNESSSESSSKSTRDSSTLKNKNLEKIYRFHLEYRPILRSDDKAKKESYLNYVQAPLEYIQAPIDYINPTKESTGPRAARNPVPTLQVATDVSCGPHAIQIDAVPSLKKSAWVYISCRNITTKVNDRLRGHLEVLMLWSENDEPFLVDQIEVKDNNDQVYALRLDQLPGHIKINRGHLGEEAYTLKYFVSERAYKAFVGIGLGPYLYTYEGSGHDISSLAGVLTIYGSYAFSETSRLIFFDLTALHPDIYTDFGLYQQYESFRVWDRKISFHFMLGGHAALFRANGKPRLKWGIPQGAEIVFRSLPFKNYNTNLGGFIYPEISGKSYFNFWLRWGNPKWFVEFNYILFREVIDPEVSTDSIFNRSVGIAFGMPLYRFF